MARRSGGGENDLSPALQAITQAAQAMQATATLMAQMLGQLAQARGTAGAAIPGSPAPVAQPAAATQIHTWEDDPFSEPSPTTNPPLATPITVDVPVNNNSSLQVKIAGTQPPAGLYAPGSASFRYWALDEALIRGINMWASHLPAGTRWTTNSLPMSVTPVAGDDLNANYSRDFGLRFYAQTVQGTEFFSGESPDVACHELGHAILDAFKPELWDAASAEVAAFHESFGDMSAILSALQLPTLRQKVLKETDGHLNVNSRVSRLAEQLGWAIRQLSPSAVDPDCLRNAANRFFYQDPNDLPPLAPASQLASEAHSFSRVFTGAFLDALAGMLNVTGQASEQTLLTVSGHMAQLLVDGILLAPVTSDFYSQVAAAMIQADQARFHGRYTAALTSGFIQHGVLSPSSTAALATAPVPRPQAAEGGPTQLTMDQPDNEGYKLGPDEAPTMPLMAINAYGMTLNVHAPAEVRRFTAASAALSGETEAAHGPEEVARSFLEDLIQLDRIDFSQARGSVPERFLGVSGAAPPDSRHDNRKTHHLIRVDNKLVLKRRHFLCPCHTCCH